MAYSSLAAGAPPTSKLRLLEWSKVNIPMALDYHVHTTYTDGEASVGRMADAALAKGIAEVLFSEHVRSTSTYFPVFAQEVRALRRDNLTAWVGAEAKVLSLDGTLDCPDSVASTCDALIGSVHSLPPGQGGELRHWSNLSQYEAIELEFQYALAIVEKSQAHILGHPMGMVITRFGICPKEQLSEIAHACRKHGKAFELNGRYSPDPVSWIEIVKDAKCPVSVGSDAHNTEMVGTAWGVFVGRELSDR